MHLAGAALGDPLLKKGGVRRFTDGVDTAVAKAKLLRLALDGSGEIVGVHNRSVTEIADISRSPHAACEAQRGLKT